MTRVSSTKKATAVGDAKVFTVFSGDDAYGLPIDAVQTIFRVDRVTPVPLAPSEVIGLINLRGRINTAVSLRRILGELDGAERDKALAICIERRGELFALVVDRIGDVVTVREDRRVSDPPNADRRRAAITSGVFRLDDGILPVLNLDTLFDFGKPGARASGSRQESATP